MMIFNSFTVASYYNFGAQLPNGRCHRFFLPTNKTFQNHSVKEIIKFTKLIYEQVD